MADVLNPYAYIGNLHNNGLDFIAQNLLSFDSLPDGVEVIINLTATFVNNSGTFPETTYHDLITAGTIANNNVDLDLYPSDFTERQIEYAKQVEAVFDGYEEPFQHIDEINEKIDNEVQNVFTSELSEDEQEPLLIGLAVGKSSLYYWNQQVADSNSYWNQVNNNQPESKPMSDVDWNKVGNSDLKGAVRGFFRGLGGGPKGAVAGALVGGGVKSGVEVVKQLVLSE